MTVNTNEIEPALREAHWDGAGVKGASETMALRG